MTTTSSTNNLRSSLDLVEVKPGLKFSKQVLLDILPDVETALFFGKVYELDYRQLSQLLSLVLRTDVAAALFAGDHSTSLQGYLHDTYHGAEADDFFDRSQYPIEEYNDGTIVCTPDVPQGEILPELWAQLEVEVATSIKAVAAKLESTIGLLPTKQGQMMFQTMRVMNAKRPVLGDYKPVIHHQRMKKNLVIFDVSGSMTSTTVRTIVDDVVALSYMAEAALAIISNTCTYWEPGTFDSETVLKHAEFSGTHYEMLTPLFDAGQDWGTVITIADYDSFIDARDIIGRCNAHIDELLDISLVNRPTFMAECVGQLADSVRPILIANSHNVLST